MLACREDCTLDYVQLFELWADFSDEDSAEEAQLLAGRLGPLDRYSFLAFCAGYRAAVEALKRG